jgi:hypothetical protein
MANKKLATINIKGKDYVTVAQRVLAFNELYPNGMIETTITYLDETGVVRAKCKVTPDVEKPLRYFVGHSEESRESSMVNKTAATENCETSAVGRALGLMGIGVIEGIASVDEINKAKGQEKAIATRPLHPSAPRKTCITCKNEFNPKPGTENFAKECTSCYLKKKAEANEPF